MGTLLKLLRRFDKFVLARYTEFAHRFQRKTQRTCYWLARHAFVLVIMAGLWEVAASVHPIWPYLKGGMLAKRSPGARTFLTLLVVAVIFMLYRDARKCEQADRDLLTSDVVQLPKFLLGDEGFRLWNLFLSVLHVAISTLSVLFGTHSWEDIFNDVQFFLLLSGLYLIAVVPLPPSVARQKERTYSSALRPVPVPMPPRAGG